MPWRSCEAMHEVMWELVRENIMRKFPRRAEPSCSTFGLVAKPCSFDPRLASALSSCQSKDIWSYYGHKAKSERSEHNNTREKLWSSRLRVDAIRWERRGGGAEAEWIEEHDTKCSSARPRSESEAAGLRFVRDDRWGGAGCPWGERFGEDGLGSEDGCV